jgi:hypothetical protein
VRLSEFRTSQSFEGNRDKLWSVSSVEKQMVSLKRQLFTAPFVLVSGNKPFLDTYGIIACLGNTKARSVSDV